MSTTAAAAGEQPPQHDMVHEDEHHEAITRIVAVALDHSAHSQHALEWAVNNILLKDTDLVVLINTRPIAVVPGPYGSACECLSSSFELCTYSPRANHHERSQTWTFPVISLECLLRPLGHAYYLNC